MNYKQKLTKLKKIKMKSFKELFGEYLKGKRVHYKCTCLFPIDVIGIIIDYRVELNELVFTLEANGKRIDVGENSPKAKIEILCD